MIQHKKKDYTTVNEVEGCFIFQYIEGDSSTVNSFFVSVFAPGPPNITIL